MKPIVNYHQRKRLIPPSAGQLFHFNTTPEMQYVFIFKGFYDVRQRTSAAAEKSISRRHTNTTLTMMISYRHCRFWKGHPLSRYGNGIWSCSRPTRLCLWRWGAGSRRPVSARAPARGTCPATRSARIRSRQWSVCVPPPCKAQQTKIATWINEYCRFLLLFLLSQAADEQESRDDNFMFTGGGKKCGGVLHQCWR